MTGSASSSGNGFTQSLIASVDFMRRAADAAHAQQATPAPAATAASTPRPESPRDAVLSIHGREPPGGASGVDDPSVSIEDIVAFNRQREQDARAAIDAFAPQREDSAILGGHSAEVEYRDALAHYHADPYVAELRRIETEAGSDRYTIPAYLTEDQRHFDPTVMDTATLRSTLAGFGIDLPINATPAQIFQAQAALAEAPDWMVGLVASPLTEVGFEVSAGTPWMPGKIKVDESVSLSGSVALSEVELSQGLERTQTFEVTLEMDNTATITSRGPNLANKLGSLSASNLPGSKLAEAMLDKAPLLKKLADSKPLLPVELSLSESNGVRYHYEAIVPPEVADRIRTDDLSAVPNPLEPNQMPVGSSVVFTSQSFTSVAGEASRAGIGVFGSSTELEGNAFGVRRESGHIVEVFSGDARTLEQVLGGKLSLLGLASAGLSLDASTDERSLSVARIDLRTVEGRQAYQLFMSTGAVPRWAPPGVVDSGTRDEFSSESTRAAEFSLLGFNGTLDMGSNTLDTRRSQWDDGSADFMAVRRDGNGLTATTSASWATDGSDASVQRPYSVVLADQPVNHNHGLWLEDVGALIDSGNRHDLEIRFSEADLLAIREMAREYHLANRPYGEDEVEYALQTGSTDGSWALELVVADTPDEIHQLLTQNGAAHQLFDRLVMMHNDTGLAVPGLVTTQPSMS